MDGSRFDQLARALARGRTRRGILGGLAALAGGAVTANRAGAVICPPGQYAGSGGRCLCKLTGRPPGANGCPCGAGQTNCSGTCVNLSSDLANCGSCGNACPGVPNGVPVCIGGGCDIECALAADPCGGECCGDGEFCEADTCVSCLATGAECASEFECCSGLCDVYSGQCIECAGAADPCGGTCCGEGEFCEAETCVACREDGAECASEFECCSGFCDTYNNQCSS
jgi:hypothetical protein